VVLLQSGKAADLAGAFGGMGSQTAFGPRGSATLLSKATTISAVVFMITSLALSVLATRTSSTGSAVLDNKQTTQQPATPAPAPAVPAQPGSPAPAGGQQPSMSLSTEGGAAGKPIPLNIQTVPPGQKPQIPQPQPSQQPPAQKQPAPAKK